MNRTQRLLPARRQWLRMIDQRKTTRRAMGLLETVVAAAEQRNRDFMDRAIRATIAARSDGDA